MKVLIPDNYGRIGPIKKASKAWVHKQMKLKSQWLAFRVVEMISTIIGLLILYVCTYVCVHSKNVLGIYVITTVHVLNFVS